MSKPRSTALVPVPVPALAPAALARRADQNPAAVYLGSLAAGSRRTMRGALRNLGALLKALPLPRDNLDPDAAALYKGLEFSTKWWEVRYQHAQMLRTVLVEKQYAPKTVNKHLAALRGVLKECWRLGYMDSDSYRRAAEVRHKTGKRLPSGRMLAEHEIAAVMSAVDDEIDAKVARAKARAENPPVRKARKDMGKPTETPAGGTALSVALAVRNAAILALMFTTGLRRAEIAGLNLVDYDGQSVIVRHGKGDKERECPIEAARPELDAWVAASHALPGGAGASGSANKPLFLNHHGKRLSPQAILWILEQVATKAEVKNFSPHDLRRTFISNAIGESKDIFAVQQIVGHESAETTALYDRRGEEAKRKVVAMVKLPRKRKGSK